MVDWLGKIVLSPTSVIYLMDISVIAVRYSLNGITKSQMDVLFDSLDQEDAQFVFRRVTGSHARLSIDDLLLEGVFPQRFVQGISRAFPPPLSFTIETERNIEETLKQYSTFQWRYDPKLLCGISLLPFSTLQQMIEFVNPWQFLRLLVTTKMGSILKPLLTIKPKGVIAIKGTKIKFILPMHRMDFLLQWMETMTRQTIDINWLSGSTGELDQELLDSVGSVDKDKQPQLENLVQNIDINEDLNFNKIFNRAIRAI